MEGRLDPRDRARLTFNERCPWGVEGATKLFQLGEGNPKKRWLASNGAENCPGEGE